MIKLETRGLTHTVVVAACEFCMAFCPADGGSVRHTRSCESGLKSERWDSPVAVAVADALDPRTIDGGLPLNAVGNGEAEDKWHAVNSRNPKDWDRAMNRDD